MAYTKQNWTTGETITAEKLNHMEDGIAEGGGSGGGIFTFTLVVPDLESPPHLDKTWGEIKDAMDNGMLCVFINPADGGYDGGQFTSIEIMHSGGDEYTVDVIVGSDTNSYVTDSEDGYPTELIS